MTDRTDIPAFPVSTKGPNGHQDGPQTWQFPGMTLRDYFAGQALAGLVVARRENIETFAGEAYDIADAMLRAREARNG